MFIIVLIRKKTFLLRALLFLIFKFYVTLTVSFILSYVLKYIKGMVDRSEKSINYNYI